ncbi:hypothetical protein FRC11_009342 [Ceratobasidium sp. 423]|nr:hypothetical protein FRC11_009342 [Ceratobasidium sp. 423]
MIMELKWYDGSPPYSVWFRRSAFDGANTVPGLGAWFNITSTNFLVPCIAPAGSRLELVLKDSTGWVSTSRGNFVVLPSSDSSCLNTTSADAVGLSQSQSVLSTVLQSFQQSVISAISVSATASVSSFITTARGVTSAAPSAAIPTASSSSAPTRRRQKPQLHIPLSSISAFDLLDEEQSGSRPRSGIVTREAHQTAPSVMRPTSTETNENAATDAPRSRLQLHDGAAMGWPSTIKNRESAVPPLPEATEQALPTPTTQDQDQRTLEQRAEQLSAPELERLAALVARRLERVRGAPPQYQATEGIGV